MIPKSLTTLLSINSSLSKVICASYIAASVEHIACQCGCAASTQRGQVCDIKACNYLTASLNPAGILDTGLRFGDRKRHAGSAHLQAVRPAALAHFRAIGSLCDPSSTRQQVFPRPFLLIEAPSSAPEKAVFVRLAADWLT